MNTKNIVNLKKSNWLNISDRKYESDVYKMSRKGYVFQRIFEYIVFVLICDPYLSKVLTTIGVPDSLVGIIATLVSISAIFELMSIFIVSKMKNVKRTVVVAQAISQLLFMSMFFAPLLPFGIKFKIIFITIALLLGYAFFYMISSIQFKWKTSFVDPTKRSSFSGGVEAISIFVGLFLTFAVGYIVDVLEAAGEIEKAFLILGITVFVLAVGNFVSLMMMKNRALSEVGGESGDSIPFKRVLKNTLGNRNFLNVIIMSSLWNISAYMTSGFMGVYKIKDLAMSVTLIQVITVLGGIFRMVFSRPFGIYSDRHTYAKGMKLAFLLSAAAFAVNIFTTKSTWWFVFMSSILSSIGYAGISTNNFNISYSYVEDKYVVQALAIKNSISGLLGFGASLVGSRILKAVQINGNMVFGIHMYGQQLLSFISLALAIVTILFVTLVVEKQNVIKQ